MMKRVLLVDDTPDMCHLAQMAFKQFPQSGDWQLITAEDAREGMEKYNEAIESGQSLDLIVSDIAMPDESGLSMIKTIRESGGSTPVMFYTAYDGALNRQMAEDLGALDYVVKPVSQKELVERIAKALEKSAAP